jgi:hypothetical protein
VGYNLTEANVRSYRHIFDDILTALKAGNELSFDVPSGQLSREYYKLREALKSAEVFPHLYDGRYRHLAQTVSVNIDTVRSKLSILAKGSKIPGIVPVSERDALLSLKFSSANLEMIQFTPSPVYKEDAFIKAAKRLGWRVHAESRQEEGKKLSYGAERIEKTASDGPKFEDLWLSPDARGSGPA